MTTDARERSGAEGDPADDVPFEALVRETPALVWTCDASGACTYVNPAWLDFTGRRREDGLGDGWAGGIHPDDLPGCRRRFQEALAARAPFSMEYRLGHREGGHRWVVDHGAPLWEGGGFAGFVGTCTDIHELRLGRMRTSLLADASAALDRADEPHARLQALVGLLPGRIADVAVAVMFEPEGRRVVAAAATDPGRRAAWAAIAARGPLSPAPSSSPKAAAVREGRTIHMAAPGERALREALGPELAETETAALAIAGVTSLAAAPLVAHDRMIGALVVLGHGDVDPGEAELPLLRELGRRAGLALDNARLLDAARRRARRMRALQEATAELSAAASPCEVGAVAVGRVRELMGASSASVFEVVDGSLVSLARTGTGHDPRWERVPMDAVAPVTDAVRTARPVWLEGLADWERRYPAHVPEARRRGIVGACALPLVAGPEPVGVLAVSFGEIRAFAEADRDTARVLAEACGQSLVRAQLQRDADAARERVTLLADVSYALDATSGVDGRLQRLADLLVPRVADLVTVRLAAREGGPSRLAAVRHGDPELEALARDLYTRHAAGADRPGPARVIATGRPELVEGATPEAARAYAPGTDFAEGIARLGVLSYVSVPLTSADGVGGALTLMTTGASGRTYSRRDLTTTVEIGRRAGLAVDNAMRWEAERRARDAAEWARGRTERLQRVTAALSAARTQDAVARVVVEESMAALGAAAGAVLVREGGAGARVLVARGYPPGVLDEGDTVALDAPTPLATVIREGTELWLERGDDWVRRFAPPRSRLGTTGIALPLWVGDRLLGALGLRFGRDARTFSPGERHLALAMAGQCAQALERARLYDAERRTADVLQRALLPPELPPMAAAHVAVRYVPAGGGRSGGDFYDALELPDGRLSVVVGDVVGHGTEAAAVMGQLRSAWRAFALDGAGPATVLRRLSHFAEGIDGARVATVACALLSRRHLRYACAGHPPPLIRRPDGGVEYLTDGRGPPLAVASDVLDEGSVDVAPGTTLLLYTDGVIERDRDIERGMDELAAVVAASDGGTTALLDELARIIGPEPADDSALLALRVPVAPSLLRLELTAEPAALRSARDGLRRWLADAGVGGTPAEDVVLAVSEALANAVEHAYAGRDDPTTGRIELLAERPAAGTLALVVSDSGRWRPPEDTAARARGRGRGLGLMRALTETLEVAHDSHGTTVRMTCRIPAGGPRAPRLSRPASPHPFALRDTADGLAVRLDGELDVATVPAAGDALRDLVLTGGRRIVADLSGSTHVGSAALRLLAEVASDMRADGRELAVCAPVGTVARRTIDLSGLGDVLVVVEHVPDADA